MDRIQLINAERIAWCCADHGLTWQDLATQLGIAETRIERVMAGEEGLTFKQLRKIADYFGRGVLFFLEAGPVDEAQAHTPQFRTLANQKPELTAKVKTLIERVEKQREIYLSLLEDLDEDGRTQFKPPRLPEKAPAEAALITRKWLGLTDKNNFETYRAAVEARGVLVFRSNGYAGKWQIEKENPILAFALYDPACPMIFIKKQESESRQAFSLMHELGHLLLHKASSIDDEQDFYSHQGWESDTNAFAGHLLVPDSFLAVIRDVDRPGDVSRYDDWLRPQRGDWGVSSEVILRRLLDAGRLSQTQYTAYRQWRNQIPFTKSDGGTREYRHREPKHVFGDPYVRTVLDALNARHITLAKASSYLDNLKIEDLHKLERHYAGI